VTGLAHLEQGDYGSALASAELILKTDPGNKSALALKYASVGRTSRRDLSSNPAPQTSQPALPRDAAATNGAQSPKQAHAVKSSLSDAGAIESLHSVGDEQAAPEATYLDRIKSFLMSDGATLAEDVSVLRRNASALTIPETAVSLGTTNPGALPEFVAWLRTVKRDDMPPLDYGIIDAGLFGNYQMATLSKGDVTPSHHIREAEPEARSAVLMHELYHYWDKKVAHNHYENVSYGKIGEGTEPQHEYNAYQLTAIYWKQFKPKDARSPLARALDRLPVDPKEVQAAVDAIESQRKRR